MSWGAQNRSKDAKTPSGSSRFVQKTKTGVMRYPAIFPIDAIKAKLSGI
jgi:hypothetical protein